MKSVLDKLGLLNSKSEVLIQQIYPKWILQNTQGVVVRFHVQQKASKTEVVGTFGEGENSRLKIRISSPPVDGAANEELLRFIKKITGLPNNCIHLIRGDTSRSKDLLIINITIEELYKKLGF